MMEIPEGPFRLGNARVPAAMAEGLGPPDEDGFVRASIPVSGGRIADAGGPALDLAGAIVLPGLVDCHTHLDKGHIWPRCPNPDGTFRSAIEAVAADRGARWTEADVRARMEFGLRAAHARGTVAMRTHIDTGDHRTQTSWAAFAEAREAWAGRIALQAAALTTLDAVDDPGFPAIADLVAGHGGVLGAVTYPMPEVDRRLERFLGIAAERGMDADFHADENLDPASDTLARIAGAVIRTGFPGRVLVGHCCSLGVQGEAEAMRTVERVAEAGLHVVSLPLCNLYLQDRRPGRTPRLRGITLVHELAAAGVPVSFASDNTRDPFYAYGDLDMAEVWREATRIAHLDHPVADWPASVGPRPAAAMGIDAGTLRPGAPADLIVMPGARGWTELFARPHADRIVLRRGRPIDTTPPDYGDLDSLMERP